MRVFTIGFTKKSARQFFELLRKSGAKRLVDVRLNNVSQLAGFTKRDDLRYFLHEICSIEYVHQPELAPTKSMLDAFKQHGGTWADYERQFLSLMRERQVEVTIARDVLADACLLCSEPTPEHCHRRLVAEYLRNSWGTMEITHL